MDEAGFSDVPKPGIMKYAAHIRDSRAASTGSTSLDGELPWLAVEEMLIHHREVPLAAMSGTLNSLMHFALLRSVVLGLARNFKPSPDKCV